MSDVSVLDRPRASPRPVDAPRAPAPERPIPAHLHALDALRGLAALSVVFWHWQHFFFATTAPHKAGPIPGFSFAREPWAGLFLPLYAEGWRAVELFFSLSGFVFAWLYGDSIRERVTTWRAFVVLRLSRLYPLHLATLLIVALGQWWVTHRTGTPFVYQWNEPYEFALQLAFAGNWGLERGDSFNGPTWSVSVEILLYGLFFLACRGGLRRWWQYAALSAVGFALIRLTEGVYDPLAHDGRGIFSFFLGGVTFHLYRALWKRQPTRGALGALAALTAALWVLVPFNMHGWLFAYWNSGAPHPAVTIHGHDLVLSVLARLAAHGRYGFELLVFPLTILTLALWESARGPIGQRLRWLGDISYASYLIHFPLQLLAFSVLVVGLGLSRTLFYSPKALVGFFALLVPLSVLVYRRFELPLQRCLRTRFLGTTHRTR